MTTAKRRGRVPLPLSCPSPRDTVVAGDHPALPQFRIQDVRQSCPGERNALLREGLGARFVGAREGEGSVPGADGRFLVGRALGGADALVDPMLDVEITGG